ncbi:MAG: hypothetical protein NC308_07290 [Clostridium sp.]|nr:hypothetical protein [Bacteroides sp.]MCM1198676.1 hypothetical protein [Clostridium sp.]
MPPLSVLSPQTADMMRYDTTPVDLYTGRISLEIPLITIKDKDFDFPISIRYNSGGFKPADPDNIVGRNWMLNCGGAIYREINGVPDEVAGFNVGETIGDNVDGFCNILKYPNVFPKDSIRETIYKNPYDYAKRYNISVNLSTIPGTGNGRIESTADLYHFSFGGYSGKFMIGFDGKISSVTTSGKECTVDLSEYKIIRGTNPYDSKIRIISDDGYIYVFGGSGYSSMEYTALSWEKDFPYYSYQPSILNPHQITAWYLTKIIAPDGRELNIYYKEIDESYHINPYNMTLEKNRYDESAQLQYSYRERSYYSRADIPQLGFDESFVPDAVPQRSLTKTAMIDRIETDMWTVRFFYSKRGNLPSKSEKKQFYAYCGAKLDSIVLTSSGKRIEHSTLDYVYHSGNRMFLGNVTNSRFGKYSFTYNEIQEPSNATLANTIGPLTTNIDHWGYWRGSKKSGMLFPRMRTVASEPYMVAYVAITDDRQPTGDNVDATLMKEVIVPTGGRCAFEYEPNYRASSRTFSLNTCVPAWTTAQGGQKELSGGARIKSIKYYDKDGKLPVKQRMYDYTNLPEGEINFVPLYRYTCAYWNPDEQEWIIRGAIRKSDGVNWCPSNYDVTGYSKVKEYFNDFSNSTSFYKTTYFATQNIYGDIFPVRWGIDPGVFVISGLVESIFPSEDGYMQRYNSNLVMRPMRDSSPMIGKILEENYYSSDGNLLRKDEYTYSLIPKDTVYNIYSPPIPALSSMVGVYDHVDTEIFYKFLMTEKLSTEYFHPSGKSLTETSGYEYDKEGYLLSETAGRNGTDFRKTEYTYTHKYQVPPDKRTYSLTGHVPELVYEETYTSSKDSRGYWRVNVINVGKGYRPVNEVSYDYYDDYRNPGQVYTRNGRSVVYIWGYAGQYLMARIENATYTDVTMALETSPRIFSSLKSAEQFLVLENLRELLPEAQVTTYAYSPQVGVTSITSPSGQKREYRYDNASRLIRESLYDDIGVPYVQMVNSYNIVNM